MQKILVLAVLMLAGLMGCQNSESKKAEKFAVISVDDLNRELKTSPEQLRAKYNGKEVAILGTVTHDFDPDPALFEPMGYQNININGSKGNYYVGVNCHVEKQSADKFLGLKDGDIVGFKGILNINDGNMELKSCSRNFRESK